MPLVPMATCHMHIPALLLPAHPHLWEGLLGGSFWGKEGCRGALPEGCALPWSWRAARVSRRCARCCAGCSAAPGTPGWPSRCSGPFGTKQKQDSA